MPKIAICTPERNPYSTTFIRAHIEQIDAEVVHFYGQFFPDRLAKTDESIYPKIFSERISNSVNMRFGRRAEYKNWCLRKQFKKYGIELVLAEFGMVGAELTDVCKSLQIPLIVHFHGLDAYITGVLAKYKSRYEAMFAYASYVIGVSQHMVQQLLRLGVPAEKLIYNCYGPNPEFFSVRPKFEAPHFVAIGRFVDKKAPHITTAAFREVLRELPSAKLTMIGDGQLLPVCQQLVRGWGISHAVTFAMVRTLAQIMGMYPDFSCFVQHSITAPNGDSEGTPVAVIEASAAGLPVVATRHAGIPDIVQHGKSGMLLEELDIEGMSAAMLFVAKDLENAKKMGAEGRKIISNNFTMDRHLATLNDLIRRAVI